MDEQPFRTISSKVVWRSRWYALRQDRIRLPDGNNGLYTVVDRYDGAVFILPLLDNDQAVLIRHYRYTVGRWLWEIPAGGINAGETAEKAARRELREEIGGVTRTLVPIGSFFTMAGISNERSYVFIAREVELHDPVHEPTEVIERHVLSLSKVVEMARKGEIEDGPSALSILLCETYIR